ncbi:hypothetical protein BDV37DRAFT_265661 [Aspergillus pseudonomiae]|uniref:Uncharacterized protein n=1 Tax=Aspergillus pseudonomiae TaxID=1506151 RepID=A0A5N7CTB2_9EURO|nr:uncharacterized protein BDV37DRAFT_265661 [Aspergillus pseudonomiae]KAE8397441.1 hypothetical protein BDV37DRAFT_265661 [Aspergillus pseudonomiae]
MSDKSRRHPLHNYGLWRVPTASIVSYLIALDVSRCTARCDPSLNNEVLWRPTLLRPLSIPYYRGINIATLHCMSQTMYAVMGPCITTDRSESRSIKH